MLYYKAPERAELETLVQRISQRVGRVVALTRTEVLRESATRLAANTLAVAYNGTPPDSSIARSG